MKILLSGKQVLRYEIQRLCRALVGAKLIKTNRFIHIRITHTLNICTNKAAKECDNDIYECELLMLLGRPDHMMISLPFQWLRKAYLEK